MKEFGIVGMVADADIYAIKALDSNGEGYVSDIIEGIDWAIKNDLDILNMSLSSTNDSESLHDIIRKVNADRIVMVASAGNNYGGASEFPAAYPEVISVGARDENGLIADFSALEGVDVYAPGVNVYSNYINDGYLSMDGTSMAAHHYTGKIVYTMIN